MTEEFKSVITLVIGGFKHSAREAQQALKDIQRQIDNTNGKRAFADINNDIEDLKNKVQHLKAAIASGKAEKFDYNAQELLDSYEQQISALEKEAEAAKGVKEELEEVAKTSKKASKDMLNVFSVFKNSGNIGASVARGVSQSIKSMLKYSFAIRSVYALVAKLKSFAGEGIKNLVQVSATTNAAVSSMISALTQLKNSFAAAFSPIIEVVAPYVSSFLHMMADAISYVGAFFAALTGKSTFTKAVAVQQDYAASLSDASSGSKKLSNATKDAADAQKELNRQLMGFDEINKLNDNNDINGDTGGAGGGGDGIGGTGDGVSPRMMFTEENIPGIVSDWAKMFREAWENADFTEIGAIIGRKLKDTLDNIPWDAIKTKCEKVAKSLATFLNGFIEVPGLWSSIGTTIANGFNVAFNTLNTFLENFHWSSLASGFAEAIQSAFVAFQWGEITRTISNILISGLDFIRGFIDGINWNTLHTDFYNAMQEAIKGINWKGLGKSLVNLCSAMVNNALDGVNGSISLGVKLVKSGWSTLPAFIGSNKILQAAIQLVKRSWSSLTGWIGTSKILSVGIKLVKSGWSSVTSWLGQLSAKFNINLPKVEVTWSGSPIKLPHFNIRWNAKGGILDGATLFGMAGNSFLGGGEAGREAVLPLDRNTDWMDTLASKVGQYIGGGNLQANQPIVIQVKLDGRIVGQSTVDYINRQRRITGQSPIRL